MIKRLENNRKNYRGNIRLRSKQVQGSCLSQCRYLAQMIFDLFKDRESFKGLQTVA